VAQTGAKSFADSPIDRGKYLIINNLVSFALICGILVEVKWRAELTAALLPDTATSHPR